MIVEFRDHHGLMFISRENPHETRQIQHRHHMPAQRHNAIHAIRHVRRARDLVGLANFLDLEHIDAELLTAAQAEQQDFHLVGAGQIGARINVIQHAVLIAAQHVFRVSHFFLLNL